MSAGQLNRRITVEARNTSPDIYGNTYAGWASLIESEPAEIRPLRGDESVEAAKLEMQALVEIRVRYSSRTAQILPAHRIRNTRTSETYNVRYIEQPDMRGKYLKIVAELGVADG